MKKTFTFIITLIISWGLLCWPAAYGAPTDMDSAVRELLSLENQLAGAQKNYRDASEKLDKARAAAGSSRKELDELDARIKDGRQKLSVQANYLYRTGSTKGVLDVMFSSQSFEEVLGEVAALTQIADNNAQTLSGLRRDMGRRITVQADLDQHLKDQEAQTAMLKLQSDQIAFRLADQQALVNKLSEQQLKELEVAQKAGGTLEGPKGSKPGNYVGTGYTFSGEASWYDTGSTTANGEHYNPDGLTAAHLGLAFGTLVRVTYQGRSVVVRINDRGPYIKGRVIDLSRGAARAIGLIDVGHDKVTCVVVGWA